ncbi:MAG: hypothetical protein NTW10_10840 [Bacteroidetes bacterium]|nr:hypothetical protein [Bacteroidota bacterium]
MERKPFLFILFISISFHTYSQDDHYWAQQFGAISTLMGGAMIGGVRDNTAIFYNPGALGFITIPSLSVDANVYKVDKIFIEDGAGTGLNLNSAQLSIYPQIISGLVSIFRNERLRLSYALLTRQYSNVLMNLRYNGEKNSTPEDPDSYIYTGAFDYTNQLNEQWGGLGLGYKINDNLSVGVSGFITYRAQSYQLTNFLRIIDTVNNTLDFGSINNDKNLKYKVFSMLGKFGINYEKGCWRLGLTVTTPAIKLYSSGEIQREVSMVLVTDDTLTGSGGFAIIDRTDKAKVKFRYPLSIGAGAEYKTEKTQIALSAEYFFGIKPYHLFEPNEDPFVYPPAYKDSADSKPYLNSFLHVINSSKPVLNFAVGFNQRLGKQFSLMAGFRTDFSSFRKSDETDSYLHTGGQWDLYHVSLGLSYHKIRNSITAGITYTVSPSKNIENLDHISPDLVENTTPKVFAQTIALIIGYTYYFPK